MDTHPHSAALIGQFSQLVPEIILVVFASVLFVGGAFTPPDRGRHRWGAFALLGLVLALAALFIRPDYAAPGASVFGVPFVFDRLALFTRAIAFAGGLVLLALSWYDMPDRQIADYRACVLLIVAGTGLVGASNDLVAMFLSLELVSIPTYILLYLPRHDEPAQEAALKYFLLSILSSALLLFGFSYLYGLGGTTNLAGILDALQAAQRDGAQAADRFAPVRPLSGVALVALIMVVAGLGFRITAVPFHFYAPDVYQGTSPGIAGLLAYIPKVAGFVALVRVLGFVLPPGVEPARDTLLGMALSRQVPILLWFLAAITMTLGNLLALLQDNLKRLLAYSSVAHAGYMLVALASAPYLSRSGDLMAGTPALLFYLVAYGAMTVGVFAVIAMFDAADRPVEVVDDLAGLGRSHPGIAFMVMVLLFSLIGFPLTAGFGKWLILFGALNVEDDPAYLYRVLAFIGALNAAISGWYYLRIIAVMYLRTSIRPITRTAPPATLTALVVCVLLTIGLGVPPGINWLLRSARQSATPAVVAPQEQAMAVPR